MIEIYCKGCQKWHSDFECIECDVITNTQFTISEQGELSYGATNPGEAGFIERFQCTHCGWIIRYPDGEPIRDEDDLIEYVQANREG